MVSYSHITIEDLADDIGSFVYATLNNILPICEKFRPVLEGMTLEEKRETSKLLKGIILDRLKAYSD